MNEQELLERLASLRANLTAQKRVCTRYLAASEPVARKAHWAYRHYLARTGKGPAVAAFVPKYMAAWRDSILHLVNQGSSLEMQMPAGLTGMLLVGWHFPEHLGLIPFILKNNILCLVASEESWMEDMRRQHCAYCFRGGRISSALPRAFHAGRPVFAMFDHCYESSRHIVTEFLSYPAPTPTGVLELAARHQYRLGLVSVRGRIIKVLHSFPATSDIRAMVQTLNRSLEEEILRRPARWLLWPAVPQRWIGVDYGA